VGVVADMDALPIDEISGVSGAYINVQHAGKATLHDPAFMPDPACRFVDLCADRGNPAAGELGAFHKSGFVSSLMAIIDLG